MAILTGSELRKAIEQGRIQIDPFEDSQVGPGSIDLTLGNHFRVFKTQVGVYHILDDSNFDEISETVSVANGDFITVNPGEMILGITKERVTLADDVCGWLEGRSRFARFGLAVHVTAGFMHPGISNHQVLEIVNLGHTPLALHAGTRICQVVFEQSVGRATYQGRFRRQDRP
jgi:dCTP deaminase